MHTAPTAISQGADTHASTTPATAPTASARTAAISTERGAASREPTRRSGPDRTSSVPRMPSE